MPAFPYRQVHLDFHTSPHIPGIGSRFDKSQFQAALKAANLDSITVFAKCHHGLCYYPTKVGTMHPNLNFDLTGAMVEAAHEIGVRAPVYITAGWSDLDSKTHPEWIQVKPDGSLFRTGGMIQSLGRADDEPREVVAWDTLCLNDGAYAQHIYDITEEICQRYPHLDGLFYDICVLGDACICPDCQAGMRELGMDPTKEADQKAYYILARQRFMQKCTDILHKYHPNGTIFFNSGGAHPQKPQFHGYQTHFEMEDLPTAWGGYDALPLRARFFQKKGKPYLGMTGKFHLAWGEFGGFKCKEALKYEVCAMALQGAGCSVGDHMHPDGEMEMQTYENIGYAYRYLDEIAPFCYGGQSTARLGLVFGQPGGNAGTNKLLSENQIEYDVITESNFADFDTVIITEGTVLSQERLEALQTYLAQGGKLLFFGDGLVKDGAFQIDCGCEYVGPSQFDCDYLMTDLPYRMELPKAPLLCTIPGQQVKCIDAQVLAYRMTPYFNRTMGHFCGHKNTPFDKTAPKTPAIVRKGNVVYVAHSLPSQYHAYGSLYHKRYFMMALEQLFRAGAFEVEGMGSMGRATMIHQPEQNRYCLNLLYASPVHRGSAHIIEDITPIYHISIRLHVPQKILRAYVGTTGEVLPVVDNALVLPKLECHAPIVLEYENET